MFEFLFILIKSIILIIFRILLLPFKILFYGVSFKKITFIFRFFTIGFISLLSFILYTGKFIPSKIPFDKTEKEFSLSHNDLKAIMKMESGGYFMVVNVNDRGFIGKQLKGATYFEYEIPAYIYIHSVLRTLNQNFDIGPFQINSFWLKEDKISNSYISLFNPFESIRVSAKILGDNYSFCRNKGFKNRDLSLCAFSRYNTGKTHLDSSIGLAYANKVLSFKDKNINEKTFDQEIMYIPFYKYIKL